MSNRHLLRPRRHPCDKGSPIQRQVGEAFRWMLNGHFWRRHLAPFNKTERGQQRRQERLFVRAMQHRGT